MNRTGADLLLNGPLAVPSWRVEPAGGGPANHYTRTLDTLVRDERPSGLVRYIFAALVAVACGKATSPQESESQVERAADADGSDRVAAGGAGSVSNPDVNANAGTSSGGAGRPPINAGPACCPGVPLSWARFTLSEACELGEIVPGQPGCWAQLPDCGDPARVDAADLSEALAHPDVARALSEGDVFFGWTGLVLDFHGSSINVGGSHIEIGFDCVELPQGSPPPDCRPIPPGVAALRVLLQTLEIQQSTLGSCGADAECYAPISNVPSCSALIPRFAYDLSLSTCVELPEGAGCSSSNVFGSLEGCQAACSTDPCAFGVPFGEAGPPEACPVQAQGHCFPNDIQACLCACRASGAPLEGCGIDESYPAVASCSPR
jgi:hypothetical protein